jgi:lipopolysaccharide transport system ATP-binding protein
MASTGRMNATVIHGEGLGKLYRRGLQIDDGLRHSLEAFVRSPIASLRRKKEETFWALKDVSLEVKEGEVLGLIGRNGAGKTTLLKILSRITRPTTGWAEIHGRVGTLLEVGTGFHPELSGRENTFLSGAILGMNKSEIERKFDEIVAFAELEKFIDTPVKHYSSGMFVRLAFAVAAHLEPEILLVDEVLAVGDAAFQRKCLGKMGDVSRQGRTVLFVSHNMTAMRSLCSRAMLLEGGEIGHSGPIAECIDLYLARGSGYLAGELMTADIPRPLVVAHDLTARITRVRFDTPTNQALLYSGRPMFLEMELDVAESVSGAFFGFAVDSSDGVRLFECRSIDSYEPIQELRPGKYSLRCGIQSNPLNPGFYRLTLGMRCERKGLDWLPDVMTFQVEAPEKLESLWIEERSGLMRQASEWSLPTAGGNDFPVKATFVINPRF